MDNLTHTLTGLMMSRAGLQRFFPRAPLLLMLAANTPDIDGFTLLAGASTYFRYHRSFTHALVLAPLMALLPVLAVRLFQRSGRFPWLTAWLLALAGVISHLLLDLTNPYGIRLLLPFSERWPVLSITSVVDIWVWSILLVAALAPLFGKLVSSEIGGKPGAGRGTAITALILLGLYDSGRFLLHDRAIQLQSGMVYEGESPVRVLAYPDKLNPFAWVGVVETRGLFVVQSIQLTGNGRIQSPRLLYKPEQSPVISAAAATPIFRNLMGFSQALLWRTFPGSADRETIVEASDLFFGFSATAVVDANGRIRETSFHF